MVRYFAYGSNMSRAQMRRRCPGAAALGRARLDHWRFVVGREGYASVVPARGGVVHGVMWSLTPRDLGALNAYESLDSGLYLRRILPVRREGRIEPALTYVARNAKPGRPRPGYHDAIVAAARDWNLPAGYVRSLQRLAPARVVGTRRPDIGEIR